MFNNLSYYKIVVSVMSAFVFLMSSNAFFSNSIANNKQIHKFEELKLEKQGIKVFIPTWDIKKIENSNTLYQSISAELNAEINISIEDTKESLESYWASVYPRIKDFNSNTIVTVQDTTLGELPSKLLYIKAKSPTDFNSCVHHAIKESYLIQYTYLSKSNDCQDPFFVELSKIAITKI
jgi:hypothetical protein